MISPRHKRASRLPALLLALAVLGACSIPVAAAPENTSLELYRTWVEKLASKEFEGRGPETEGIARARDMIANHFRSIGLKGAFKSELTQKFAARAGVKPSKQALSISASGISAGARGAPGRDFVPFGFSANGSFSGEAVFVGYAIDADERKYDSIGTSDDSAVKGRVAVALRYEPHDNRGRSRWTDRAGSWSREAALIDKADWAADHGAVALLVVNPPAFNRGGLVSTRNTAFGTAKIPALHISGDFFRRILGRAGGAAPDLEQLIEKANKKGGVDPLKVALSGDVELKAFQNQQHNVAAVLPGEGELADQYVFVGAHYDHLGHGRGSKKTIYPGADDNASGTAGVMLLARRFAGRAEKLPGPRRSIVFAAFASEEVGLLGSRHMVKNLSEIGIKSEQVAAMFNMDMIGRMRDDRLGVWGVDSGKGLRDMVAQLGRKSGLRLRLSGPGAGPSDHASFYRAKIPVLCLNSGIHRDMHKTRDTADRINYPGAARILEFAEDVITNLATRAERFAYVPPPPRRRRAYLGVLPGYEEGRCRFSRVLRGGPAHRAGLRSGDVLLEMNGQKVDDVPGLLAGLRHEKPGSKVRLRVLRGGETVDLTVTLGSR